MPPVSTIFLCGDVMTGRGIDQILPHPSAPHIFEPYLKDARGYLTLAERAHGGIPQPAGFTYPWGEAFEVWEKMAPDLRIINLETSVTRSEEYWKGKGINYRMHPENLPCLTGAEIDACTLANNHVLDWGYSGLQETLGTLHGAGVKTAGAGRSQEEAAAPAELVVPGKGAVQLFGFGVDSSGIPDIWGAGAGKPGVNLLPDLSAATVARIATRIKTVKTAGNTVIASLHWGGNWGFEVSQEEREFAHRLIDSAGVDIVHGHSSHHVKGIELYRGRLVIYGCGDFINDYEGIRGYQEFRGELGLMYFADIDAATGELARLTMVPTRQRRFRIQLATASETAWLTETLNREGKRFGTCVRPGEEGALHLERL
ncbi:MAG: poly-gamma-glutamate biosynthesis protein [Geobacteraceae bacterium GWC2_58_44]|nr:MAG: poly-gamma-glutamate biosynthesis protein [Geobacteraceae bacterium GWC2_58_44]HBG05816.1 poly-gamma-glutamate biosynthesis protein [Geobacter sp.]